MPRTEVTSGRRPSADSTSVPTFPVAPTTAILMVRYPRAPRGARHGNGSCRTFSAGHPNVGTRGREEKSWGRAPTGRSLADSARAVLDLALRRLIASKQKSAMVDGNVIAGYALGNDATVLATDHGFAHIAAVTALQHEHVQPSLD